MVLLEKLYTAEEFFEYIGRPENDDRRFELDEGRIVRIKVASPYRSVTGVQIGYFLNTFVLPRNLGYVTGANGAFILTNNCVRFPNVAFVSKAQVTDLSGHGFSVAPDLAVELVSPDEDIFKKAREYLHAGTRLVWAVYTDEKTVYVMTLDADGSVRSKPFDMDATLDGGDVLPVFTLPVRDIFPD